MTENWAEKFLEIQKEEDYERMMKGGFIFLGDVIKTLEEERKRWFDKLLN